jgi:hypothetical protein
MARSPALIHQPARDIPVRGEYDIVVLGGGPAGIAAAAAAGALGRRTTRGSLIERKTINEGETSDAKSWRVPFVFARCRACRGPVRHNP